jgi:hypothetical protein
MTATMSSLILKRKWKFKFELVGPGRSAWSDLTVRPTRLKGWRSSC